MSNAVKISKNKRLKRKQELDDFEEQVLESINDLKNGRVIEY